MTKRIKNNTAIVNKNKYLTNMPEQGIVTHAN